MFGGLVLVHVHACFVVLIRSVCRLVMVSASLALSRSILCSSVLVGFRHLCFFPFCQLLYFMQCFFLCFVVTLSFEDELRILVILFFCYMLSDMYRTFRYF